MQVPTTTSQPPGDDSTRTNPGLRRALVTSSVGSALEYYDFAIYGIASALVFKHLFFPGLGPAVGLVAIFATYAPWDGPTTGPEAVPGKTVVYVAQSMTNPGVGGTAKGVKEAAQVMGWQVRIIDGQGTPAGIQAALSQAVAVKPAGIVLSGFDPKSTAQQLAQADAAGIPLIGWHAVATPGPSKDPKLFSNVTTKVEDVAKISADWIISQSKSRRSWRPAPTSNSSRSPTSRSPTQAPAPRRRSPPCSPASAPSGRTPWPSTTCTSPMPPRPCGRRASRAGTPRSTSARVTATRPPSSASTAKGSRRPRCRNRCPRRGGRS
ncbi:substrate-binding domain-containing protein [Nonomuraea basaltis]|uniref:substrate-binding domain-containing protein n=1 Tax=Nonomuraea basaltis TaxID=2495887 RepID=UPI00197F19B0|nr:substrate-binding domain-containing protein [Nonomuraea basaltis]